VHATPTTAVPPPVLVLRVSHLIEVTTLILEIGVVVVVVIFYLVCIRDITQF
jgi:hypothetical protein